MRGLADILDAAKYMLVQARYTVTQLELQKLLYLAQMTHLGEYNSPLLAARFEAWKFGPVNPDLYRVTRRFGASPLRSSQIQGDATAIKVPTHKDVLNEITDKLAGKTAAELIQITHWEHGAWKKTYDARFPSLDISERLMRQEYMQRKRRYERSQGQQA
ncbi:MAG: Panacea domain-containing protein [Bacteroidota bacterium]|nr:Panacea domain-containing protein [Bacteroidota bacterium]MDE2833768.1 Panacea domain-containing protein [Bacteroidota bacterium]